MTAIMPVKDDAANLAEAVRSVLGQSYHGNIDVVMGVAPSADDTAAVASRLVAEHAAVTAVPNAQGGTAAGLNRALDEARGDVNVRVENDNGSSDPVVVTLRTEAPGFFAFDPQGRRFVAAVRNDGSTFVGPENLFGNAPLPLPMRPAKPGELIQLFCTGFGRTNPPVPAG
ncbi:MAG: glycosyltransferase, partial [Acidimicrobiales bacterium]